MRKTIALLLMSIFLISACAQQKPEDLVGGGTPVPQETQQQGQQQTETQTSAENKETMDKATTPAETTQAQEVKEFKITAKQFSFEPSTIELNKGDKVRLVVTSTDVPHGISIPEYGINERLDPGKEVKIEFTAEKEGTFTAFCSVFCGSGHSNMKGKIVVR